MLQVFPTCEKTVLNIRTQQTFLKAERRRRRKKKEEEESSHKRLCSINYYTAA
jgi:hypothetical protein